MEQHGRLHRKLLDEGLKVDAMKYEKKLWLNKRQYIAVLDKALCIVTLDDKGEIVRVAIFWNKK